MKKKSLLRKKILILRDAQKPDDIIAKSSLIEKNLLSLEEFNKAKTIMFYVSKGSEADTHKLIRDTLKRGKDVIVPFCVGAHHKIVPSKIRGFDELKEGDFGILQPEKGSIKEVLPEEIDVFIVPGIVFDSFGHRIGWGRGFYDRFLEKAPRKSAKIGICFDFQLVRRIPKERHDILMDIVVTDKQVIRTGR